MRFTAMGLVLREVRYKEADRILTVLTPDRGRLTANARGALRKNSAFAPGSQLFCYSEFCFYESKGGLAVSSADAVEMFVGLRTDAAKFSLAAYITDVLSALSDEDRPGPELLRLGLNMLYALSESKAETELVRTAFELRAAVLSGYTPLLDVCAVCENTPEDAVFSSALGGVYCKACVPRNISGAVYRVGRAELEALRHFSSAPLQRLLSVCAEPELVVRLVKISESFLSTQLDRSFKTLDYYKQF